MPGLICRCVLRFEGQERARSSASMASNRSRSPKSRKFAMVVPLGRRDRVTRKLRPSARCRTRGGGIEAASAAITPCATASQMPSGPRLDDAAGRDLRIVRVPQHQALRQLPLGGEAAVAQHQAAVRPENRHAFVQGIERGFLHLLVQAVFGFQGQLPAHIFVLDELALGAHVLGDTQAAAAGQMPGFARADRLTELAPLPHREISLFGQMAGLAQPVENLVLEGLALQLGFASVPKAPHRRC